MSFACRSLLPDIMFSWSIFKYRYNTGEMAQTRIGRFHRTSRIKSNPPQFVLYPTFDWSFAKNTQDRHFDRLSGTLRTSLSIEKNLKAHICRATNNLAPRIHTLLRLGELAQLGLSQDQIDFLARFDRYQLEGRYPDMLPPAPDIETTQEELKQADEMLKWLNAQF